jgi:hypothetical protein
MENNEEKSGNRSMRTSPLGAGRPIKRNEMPDRKVGFIVTLLKYQAIPLTYP